MATENPEQNVLDDIDALVNESLDARRMDNYQAPYRESCELCREQWHGTTGLGHTDMWGRGLGARDCPGAYASDEDQKTWRERHSAWGGVAGSWTITTGGPLADFDNSPGWDALRDIGAAATEAATAALADALTGSTEPPVMGNVLVTDAGGSLTMRAIFYAAGAEGGLGPMVGTLEYSPDGWSFIPADSPPPPVDRGYTLGDLHSMREQLWISYPARVYDELLFVPMDDPPVGPCEIAEGFVDIGYIDQVEAVRFHTDG